MYKKMSKSLEESAKQFIRVGDDYYKITFRPDKRSNLHRVLAKRSRTTITDDYGIKIIHEIPKYEDFVIVPSHTDYKQVIHGHYNKYYEISHKPKKGDFKTISSFLTHIFGEKYMDFIYDYLQLLYLKPTQSLPIILLESVERNTGKSHFGYFIQKIFQFNSIALGNSDFNSQFNSVWIDKLTIVVDETSLEEKAVMESIKRLSTEKGKVLSNSKGKDKVDIEFIGKFVFISNDEGKALPIQRGEKRFAVFKVPTFASKGIEDNPDILDDLQAEIPAFLHHLKDRQLVHPNKSRMYFDTEVYFTDQLNLYFEGNTSYIGNAIKELIKDTFIMFPEQEKLCFTVTNISDELILGKYVRHAERPQIRKAIEHELSLELGKKSRYTYFSRYKGESQTGYFPLHNELVNSFYTFNRNNYFVSYENSTIDDFQKTLQTAILQ